MSEDERYPRGRETSKALTEVRTVLSRAEAVFEFLSGPTEPVRGEDGCLVVEAGRVVREYDPDAAEMRHALGAVIGLLDRWRRVGRSRKKG